MDRKSLLSEDSNESGNSPGSSAESTSKQHPARSKKPYFRPKPRFNQPAAKLAYAAKPLPATLSTRVIKYYHPIQTTTSGIDTFSKYIYEIYAHRDHRLESAFSSKLLSYASTVALTYKIYRLANTRGYGMRKPSCYTELEEFSQALSLPEPIAKYIESIGVVSLPSGIQVVPYAPTAAEVQSHSGFLDMETIVNGEAQAAGETPRNKISVSGIQIGKYMMGAVIGAKFGALFRKVDWSIEDGNLASVAGFSVESKTGRLIGYSPCEMDQVQCKIGACYRLRDVDRKEWLGENEDYRLVHQTEPFSESVFIVDTIMNHMISR